MTITRILQLMFVVMLAGSTALANSITWIINATLSDGATVTGYFVFDPDLGSNQSITNFNIKVSAATPGTLSQSGDDGLPTSVFFPFNFTPANSVAAGPRPTDGGSFGFISNTSFTNPIAGSPSENLVLDFVPVSPLTDTSSTTINNSNINVTSGWSGECFDCDPYVTFGTSVPLTTTTKIDVTPTTAAFGNLFILTATVQDQNGNPVTNGNVTFYDGATALGTVQVVTTTSGGGTIGTATLKTILVPLGANSLTAKYVGGDAPSTSSAVIATVTGTYPTASTFASSGSAGDYTFTGSVAGAGPVSPTGNVVFTDNTTSVAVGTAALDPSTWAQTFVYAPTIAGFSNPVVATLADVNGDGIPDLFMGDANGLTLEIGNGDCTFQAPNPILSGAAAELGIAFGDFNGDGKLDVAAATGGAIVVLLGNGNGTFQTPASYDSGILGDVVVGDFNGDGILDILALNVSTNSVDLLLGNGDGTFQVPATYPVNSPLSLAVGDLNGDGNLDVVVATSPNDVTVLLGGGNGTFQTGQTYVTQYEPGNMILADFRGNGKLDLVTVFNQCCEGTDTAVYIMLGNVDGTFQAAQTILSGTNYSGVAVGDFNGDGKLDLVVSDYGYPANNVLLGDGDGTFQSAISYSAGVGPITPAVADLNHDGKPDIVGPNYNDDTDTILLNQVTQTATLSNAVVTGTGNQSVNAAYTGDTNFAGSTSNALQLAPTPAQPIANLYPTSLTFGPQQVGTHSASQAVTLINTGNATLTISSITASGDFAQSNNCGSSLAASASCTVSVTFTPTAIQTRTGDIALTDNASGSPQTVSLSGTGTGPTVSLSVSPTFPPEPVGTASPSQTITLTNTGNASLTFTAISVTSPFAIATSGTTCSTSNPVAAAATCTVAVTFTPTAAGTASGSLSFSDNAPNSSQTVALSGTGQDFTLAAAPGSPTSVSVSPGQSATYTLTATGEDGFNQSVNLTCTGAPSEATCTASPNPVTPGSSATSVTVTVTTTAPSGSAPRPRPRPQVPPLAPGLRGLLMLALVLAAMAWAIMRRNQLGASRWQSTMVPVVAGLLLTLALAGCGSGGSGSTPPPNLGTPAGSSTLTVTGTAGSGSSTLTHNVTLKLTVN
jgi:hypothetical protein